MRQLFTSGPDSRPTAQLLDEYFTMWEDPETAQTVRALFRSALESEDPRQQLQELIAERVSETLVAAPGSDIPNGVEVRLNVQLVAAHLLGIGFSRYIMEIPPLSTVSRQELIDQLEPVFDAYRQRGANG